MKFRNTPSGVQMLCTRDELRAFAADLVELADAPATLDGKSHDGKAFAHGMLLVFRDDGAGPMGEIVIVPVGRQVPS